MSRIQWSKGKAKVRVDLSSISPFLSSRRLRSLARQSPAAAKGRRALALPPRPLARHPASTRAPVVPAHRPARHPSARLCALCPSSRAARTRRGPARLTLRARSRPTSLCSCAPAIDCPILIRSSAPPSYSRKATPQLAQHGHRQHPSRCQGQLLPLQVRSVRSLCCGVWMLTAPPPVQDAGPPHQDRGQG